MNEVSGGTCGGVNDDDLVPVELPLLVKGKELVSHSSVRNGYGLLFAVFTLSDYSHAVVEAPSSSFFYYSWCW